MKKYFALFAAISLVFAMTACSPNSATTSGSPAASGTSAAGSGTSSQIDNSQTKVGVMTQEYKGDNIAEILMIEYDGNQPPFAEFGGKNPEIEMINNNIKNGIQRTYNEFISNPNDMDWMVIKSYPFTNDKYAQIVTTSCMYPTYGTDGDLESYNFSKKDNSYITVSDEMKKFNLTNESLAEKVKSLYTPETSSMSVGEVKPKGLLFTDGPDGDFVQILMEVTINNLEADPWKYFYSYAPQTNELIQLNGECLFDPSLMDIMDPPLSYQKPSEKPEDSPSPAASSQPNGKTLKLTIDTKGLTEESSGNYLLEKDSMVAYSIKTLTSADNNKESVADQIKTVQDSEIRVKSLEESSTYSSKFTYPTWLAVYEYGNNEDSRQGTALCVKTDTADFILAASVPLDYVEDYKSEINSRLSSAAIVEE